MTATLPPYPRLSSFASLMCVLSLICRWPGSCGFTALGLQSKSGVDALCQVILSLGKSAMGHGKMTLTCLHTCSDGWLPVSTAALMAQGPCLLVLSEMCSCPNERQGCALVYFHFYPSSLLPDNITLQLGEPFINNKICKEKNLN